MEIADWIQLILAFITLIVLIFNAFSFFQSRKSYNKQYEYNQKNNTIAISKTMAQLISTDISQLTAPFNDKAGKQFMDEYFSYSNQVVFKYTELLEFTKNNNFSSKYSSVEEFAKEYWLVAYNYYYNNAVKKGLTQIDAKKEAREKYIEYLDLFTLTLNKIEAISMEFVSKIADESVGYPSLHQVFLRFVKVCSIKIALSNKTSQDDFYTYTRELYRLWNERQNKHTEEVAKKEQLNDNPNKVAFIK